MYVGVVGVVCIDASVVVCVCVMLAVTENSSVVVRVLECMCAVGCVCVNAICACARVCAWWAPPTCRAGARACACAVLAW